ncbi:hypothetical protein F5X99DRAFT_405899 [Biscogniauxia marginata]|nr:hypothetical protein F5X99DRAFT_405899 [Biscogniauxia marginata]
MKFTATFVTIASLAAASLSSAAAIDPRTADWQLEAVSKHGHPLCKTQTHANLDDISRNVDKIIASDPDRSYGQGEQITGKRNVGGSDPGIMLKLEGTSEKITIKRVKELLGEFSKNDINRCGAISIQYPKGPMVNYGWLKMDYTGKVE